MHIIDCSHVLMESVPVWPGDPVLKMTACADMKDGFAMNSLFFAEHTGTHLGMPAHFIAKGRTLDQLPVSYLIRPVVCICALNYPVFFKAFKLTPDMILDWEQKNGGIPAESVVLVHTGWDRYWHSQYMGIGAHPMLPGISMQAAELFIRRNIRGIGIDSPDIGGGESDFAVDRFIAQHDVFHLENLTRLDELTNKGYTLMIGALSVKGGTGIPCRVLAVSSLA